MTGSDASAYRLARALHARGILVSAVVPPAVPRGRARLRLCATAAHAPGDIDEALAAFRAVRDDARLSPAPPA
jgi:7-keto-8-aminopelargonate synthetase-like enzyme